MSSCQAARTFAGCRGAEGPEGDHCKKAGRPSKMPKKTAEPKAPAADKKKAEKGGGKGKEKAAEKEATKEEKEPAAKKDKKSKKK